MKPTCLVCTLTIIAGVLSRAPLAEAQEAAGPEALNTEYLAPSEAEYEYSLFDENGVSTPGGRWTDSVAVDGAMLTRRVVRYDAVGEVDLVRAIVADRSTLAPITLDVRFGEGLSGVMHADYAGARVSQVLLAQPDMRMQSIEAELDQPVWELSLWGTIAASLPLEAGRQLRLPVLSQDRRGLDWASFRVEEQLSYVFEGEAVEAWRVISPEADWTFIIQSQPRRMLAVEHPAEEGRRAHSILARYESAALSAAE